MSITEKLLREKFSTLSEEHILDSTSVNQRYASNTLGETYTFDCGISLSNTSEIKVLLALAIEHNFEVHTVSSGNNWGYGSITKPTERAQVLLDLSQMNRITAVDKELGLISVEPGVTQQQLYEYLQVNNWNYMVPVTGAGPQCSILSNALERGYGITPHTDHFAAVNKMSAIIPNERFWNEDQENGFIYKSAIGDLDLSAEKFIDHTFKWGLGSYVEGLFTQSSMAVVTQITIRLAAKPESFASFYIKIKKHEKLPQAIAFIKETLRDFEGIVGSINLMDRRRVLSMVSENPNGRGAHQNMSDPQIEELSRLNEASEWLIAGSIYGKREVVKAVKKLLVKEAKFADQIIFSDGLLIKVGKFLSNHLPLKSLRSAKEQLQALEEGIDIMLGKPQQVALPLAYWRNPRVTPDKKRLMNPDKDECGLLWYAPLIPMNVNKIQEFVDFIRSTTPKYNIEPLITFTNLRYDCIDSTIPLIFDVQNLVAKQNAHDCLNELYEEGRKRGFVPYRMNVKQQKEQLSPDHMHWKVVKAIKNALDPHNVLQANRYNP